MQKPRSHVYVIAWSPRGPTKVGVTDNLVGRLGELQVASPFRLRIYSAVLVHNAEIALRIERDILGALSPFRMVGEWLKLNPNLVSQHLWSTAQARDRHPLVWKPSAAQKTARIVNLAAHQRRLDKARIKTALDDAKHLGLAVKHNDP